MTDRERTDFLNGARAGVKNSLGPRLVKQYAGSTAQLLRVRMVAGEAHAQVRLLPAGGGVDYLDLLLMRDPLGRVRIVDSLDYMNGAWAHEAINRLATTLLDRNRPSQNRNADSDFLRHFNEHVNAGRQAEALAVIASMPVTLRESRAMLVSRIQLTQGQGDAAYREALDAIQRRFPDDPSLALIRFDGHFLRDEFTKAASCLQQVQREIDCEAYLPALEALSHMKAADQPAAQRLSQLAITREPTLSFAWIVHFQVCAQGGQFDEAITILDRLAKEFDLTIVDLDTLPQYAALRASPVFKQWQVRKAGAK